MCKLVGNSNKRSPSTTASKFAYFDILMRFKDVEAFKTDKGKSSMEQISEVKKCPLCLEPLEMDDVNFFPCKCGYQICRFCWHRIRTNENGLCPACRRQYPEDPANFKPLSPEELQKLKTQKKMKDLQRKQKIAENRKQLASLRVIQKNLVFVVGLPLGLSTDADKREKMLQPFKQFGPIVKSMVNERTKYAGSQGPSACAYITYQKSEDALKALRTMSNFKFEGRTIKVSLGTTKYCSNFLKNVHCPKQECMYLHEIAEDEASFTKEEIHAGKHMEYEQKLLEQYIHNSSHKMISHNSETTETSQNIQKIEKIVVQPSKESQSNLSENSKGEPEYLSIQLPENGKRSIDTSLHISTEDDNTLQSSSGTSSDSSRNCISYNDLHGNQTFKSDKPLFVGHQNDATSFQNFSPNFQIVCNGDQMHEKNHENTRQFVHNHLYQSNSSERGPLSSPDESSNHTFLNFLSLSSNSTDEMSSPVSNNCDAPPEFLDDDLGFDPCQESLKGLQDLLISEAKEKARIQYNSANRSPFSDLKKYATMPVQSPESIPVRNVINPQIKQRDPPPGFSANNFQASQSFRPVSEICNSIPFKVSSTGMQNHFGALRNNFSMQRFPQPGISPNNSAPFVSEYSQQSPREMQGFLAQLSLNQRLQTLSQSQISNSEHHTSPSLWNHLNQSQWRPVENTFYNQSIADNRAPTDFSVRMQQQQRANELSIRWQQINAKLNSFSPFSNHSHSLFPKLHN